MVGCIVGCMVGCIYLFLFDDVDDVKVVPGESGNTA
jgi:hypothetical protein